MQILGRSPRLWLTFGAVVLLFAVTGPYGSAERLAFLPRFAYWLLLHAGAWFFALAYGARFLAPLFAKPKAWQVLDIAIGFVMLIFASMLILPVFTK